MTTSEQTDYTLSHPSFKQAIKNYNLGYTEDLRHIMIILQIEADNRRKEDSIRLVGQNHSLNKADIKDLMKKQERPSTLDCRMPQVKAISLEEHQTILNKIHTKVKSAKTMIKNQLDLFVEEFNELTKNVA